MPAAAHPRLTAAYAACAAARAERIAAGGEDAFAYWGPLQAREAADFALACAERGRWDLAGNAAEEAAERDAIWEPLAEAVRAETQRCEECGEPAQALVGGVCRPCLRRGCREGAMAEDRARSGGRAGR